MPRDPSTRPRLISRIRSELITALGGACAECGALAPLEIDHPYGRDWVPRRVASYNRWLRYRREHALGLIRVLCKDCNERIRPVRSTHDAASPDSSSQNPF